MASRYAFKDVAWTLPRILDSTNQYFCKQAEYYEAKYPHQGSPKLAEQIINLLSNADIKAEGVRRGLDHGVWVAFTCAFNPETNPLNVPIVQVSLFDSDDPIKHYALGQAVASLRDQGVLVIGAGMAVHNLRDYMRYGGRPEPAEYTLTFDEALKQAVEQPLEARQRAMAELLKRSDARRAHPSFEHLLPIHVAAGAAGEDVGRRVWTKPEGSMSWAMYRFGEPEGQS